MGGINKAMSGSDWAILLSLSVLWGGSFFFIGIAVHSVAPLTLVLIRVVIAAAVLWLFLLARREKLVRPPGALKSFLILALLNNAIPFALFAWAQREIPSGLAAILNATTPIWGVLVAHAFTSDERATPAKLLGVVLGFAGVAVLIGIGALRQFGADLLPQIACLAATLCYGLASVYGRRFATMGIPPVAVSTGQLSMSALLLLPLVLIFEPPWHAAAPAPEAWAAVVALALFSTSLAYVLYFRLLASAGATNSTLVTFLIPVTAILLGTLILREALEQRHLIGMALIGAGLAAIDGRLLRLLSASRR